MKSGKDRPRPPLALSDQEEQSVLEELLSERLQVKAPQEVYATLLDEGRYLCSFRTMYASLKSIRNSMNEEIRSGARNAPNQSH